MRKALPIITEDIIGVQPSPRPCYVRQSTISPSVMRDNRGYQRQSHLLPLAARGAFGGDDGSLRPGPASGFSAWSACTRA
jgi:hypothetical protein